MKEQLIHILDESVCLTRRQMKDYLSGIMLPEELHAAEVHLSSCPLCRMAMEGFSAHTEEALEAISGLNSGFLKEHFAKVSPQIHLNSIAPAATMTRPRKKGQSVSLWRAGSIAAALLLAFGLTWYFRFYNQDTPYSTSLARHTPAETPAAAAPPVSTDRAAGTSSGAFDATDVPAARPAGGESAGKPQPDGQRATVAAAGNETAAKGLQQQPEAARSAPENAVAATTAAPQAVRAQEEQSDDVQAAPAAAAPAPEKPVADRVASRYTTDGVAMSASPSSVPPKTMKAVTADSRERAEKKEASDDRSHMEQGDDLFEKGQYGSAVSHYREEMKSSSRNTRQQATIMAARCYLQLGQKHRAQQLLQSILAEGGPQKRTAKKMLRDLGEE